MPRNVKSRLLNYNKKLIQFEQKIKKHESFINSKKILLKNFTNKRKAKSVSNKVLLKELNELLNELENNYSVLKKDVTVLKKDVKRISVIEKSSDLLLKKYKSLPLLITNATMARHAHLKLLNCKKNIEKLQEIANLHKVWLEKGANKKSNHLNTTTSNDISSRRIDKNAFKFIELNSDLDNEELQQELSELGQSDNEQPPQTLKTMESEEVPFEEYLDEEENEEKKHEASSDWETPQGKLESNDDIKENSNQNLNDHENTRFVSNYKKQSKNKKYNNQSKSLRRPNNNKMYTNTSPSRDLRGKGPGRNLRGPFEKDSKRFVKNRNSKRQGQNESVQIQINGDIGKKVKPITFHLKKGSEITDSIKIFKDIAKNKMTQDGASKDSIKSIDSLTSNFSTDNGFKHETQGNTHIFTFPNLQSAREFVGELKKRNMLDHETFKSLTEQLGGMKPQHDDNDFEEETLDKLKTKNSKHGGYDSDENENRISPTQCKKKKMPKKFREMSKRRAKRVRQKMRKLNQLNKSSDNTNNNLSQISGNTNQNLNKFINKKKFPDSHSNLSTKGTDDENLDRAHSHFVGKKY